MSDGLFQTSVFILKLKDMAGGEGGKKKRPLKPSDFHDTNPNFQNRVDAFLFSSAHPGPQWLEINTQRLVNIRSRQCSTQTGSKVNYWRLCKKTSAYS